ADRDEAARTYLENGLAMRVDIVRRIGTENRISPAEKGHARRHAEAQPFQRLESRLGAPELDVGSRRVDYFTGFHPFIPLPRAERLQQAVTCMGVRVDKARQDKLA